MPTSRPLGITVIGGFFTVIGGTSSLVIFLEIIDSMRFFGMDSVFIIGYSSLWGFILYGGTPILLYATGMGLFMAKPWARRFTITILPILLLNLLFNITCNVLRERFYLYSMPFYKLFPLFPEVFFAVALRLCLIVLPLIFYFTRPRIRRYFYS